MPCPNPSPQHADFTEMPEDCESAIAALRAAGSDASALPALVRKRVWHLTFIERYLSEHLEPDVCGELEECPPELYLRWMEVMEQIKTATASEFVDAVKRVEELRAHVLSGKPYTWDAPRPTFHPEEL